MGTAASSIIQVGSTLIGNITGPNDESMVEIGAIVCPGDRLCPASDCTAGRGTHVKDRYIHASFVGHYLVEQGLKDEKPEVKVIRKGAQPTIPQPSDIVTVKVTRTSPRQANVIILCVGSKPVGARQGFSGVIRVQDVRATEIDKVDMHCCFRPGDIVKAEVVSLGDSRAYYLSTAKNELGVVSAKSLAGVPMVPVSWQEMQCPQSKIVEKRKVAKTA